MKTIPAVNPSCRIDPAIIKFLEDLRENNNREWFHANKAAYDAIRLNIENFVACLAEGIGSFDKNIIGLVPKDCLFRIYRDVRFAKDKSPYKTNIGAYLAKGGKNGSAAGYYLHIEPGQSFLAGGVYMPPPDNLKKVRQEIAYHFDEFNEILNDKTFKRLFGTIEGDKLVKMPKDFANYFKDEELLKFKSYNVIHYISDEQLLAPDFYKNALAVYTIMLPLNNFLNRAITG